MFLEFFKAVCMGLNILLVIEFFFDDHMHDGIEHRNITAGLELQHVFCVTLQGLTAGVHDNQGLTVFDGLLEESGRDGMVFRGVRTDHNNDFCIPDRCKRRGDGARSDASLLVPNPVRTSF